MDIGSDDRLNRLFIAGKLPLAWTTLYYMTGLNDKQFAKVEKVCHPDITMKEIVSASEVSKEKQKAVNLLFSFLKFNVNIAKVDIDRYDAMCDEIVDYLKAFPEIEIDTKFTTIERMNSVKEKVERYLNKETNKNAKESKSDEVTEKDAAKAVSDVVNEDIAA